jgi:glycosyltransferase involved in cell wall biosynthesis
MMVPFCSVIIPTIGRESLARAVDSVLSQSAPAGQLEVIVVNDSGRPLSAAAWQGDDRVRFLTTQKRERSIARNTGAAIGRGRYFCFLDDDDWLLPGAMAAFLTLAEQQPDAVWLHGGLRVVDEAGEMFGEANSGVGGNCLAPIMGGAWAPLQSSLIRADAFFAGGGFDPSLGVTQDQDLCRRLALIGDFANTPAMVACLLRGRGWKSSTAYDQAAHNTRRSRDKVVDAPGAFRRLMASANDSYWYGRVFHVYLGLALWHGRRGNVLTATSRALHALASALRAGPRLLSPSFWRGVRAEHAPGTLHFIEKRMRAARATGQ